MGSWIPKSIIEEAKKMLPPNPKYLDIGCGNGELTCRIAEIIGALEVYDVDVDERALSIANERGILTFKCDLNEESLPFSDESFDLITAIEVIEHLTNLRNMLMEAFRVLRPRDLLIIETPSAIGCSSRLIADQLKLTALIEKITTSMNSLISPQEALPLKA